MKLIVFVVILAIIFLGYWFLVKPLVENYTAGTYVITWQPPTDNGGDPNCCGYDWQMCDSSDAECKTPIDGGTVTTPTASTSKANWGKTYTIRIRAVNATGAGPWASASLAAGTGALTSITFGQTITEDGNVGTPLTPGSKQISVWVGTTRVAVPGLEATLSLTQSRNNAVVETYKVQMTYGSFSGSGNFLSIIPNVSIENNDVFNAYIYVTDAKKEAWADAQGNVVVKEGTPGAVAGISWSYKPAGACTTSDQCPSDSTVCVAGSCTVQNVFLVRQFTSSPDGKSGGPTEWYLAWSGPPGSQFNYTIKNKSGTFSQSGTGEIETTRTGMYASVLLTKDIKSTEEYDVTLTQTGSSKTNKVTISFPKAIQYVFPLPYYNGSPVYVSTNGPTYAAVNGNCDVVPDKIEVFVSTDLKSYLPLPNTSSCQLACGPGPGYGGGGNTSSKMKAGMPIGVAINLYSSSNVVSNLEYDFTLLPSCC